MEYFTLTHLTHSCEMCISKFLSKRLLEAHKIKVHRLKPKVTEVYNCDLCLTAFKKNELYKKHLDLSHKTEREMLREGRLDEQSLSFSCHLCDLKFLTDSLVDCHMINTHYAKKTR